MSLNSPTHNSKSQFISLLTKKMSDQKLTCTTCKISLRFYIKKCDFYNSSGKTEKYSENSFIFKNHLIFTSQNFFNNDILTPPPPLTRSTEFHRCHIKVLHVPKTLPIFPLNYDPWLCIFPPIFPLHFRHASISIKQRPSPIIVINV